MHATDLVAADGMSDIAAYVRRSAPMASVSEVGLVSPKAHRLNLYVFPIAQVVGIGVIAVPRPTTERWDGALVAMCLAVRSIALLERVHGLIDTTIGTQLIAGTRDASAVALDEVRGQGRVHASVGPNASPIRVGRTRIC